MLEVAKIIKSYVAAFQYVMNMGLFPYALTTIFCPPLSMPFGPVLLTAGLCLKTKPIRKPAFKFLVTKMMHAIAKKCDYEWRKEAVDYFLYVRTGMTLDMVYQAMSQKNNERITFLQCLVNTLPEGQIASNLCLKIREEGTKNRDGACAVLMEILGWMYYFNPGFLCESISVVKTKQKYFHTNCVSKLTV